MTIVLGFLCLLKSDSTHPFNRFTTCSPLHRHNLSSQRAAPLCMQRQKQQLVTHFYLGATRSLLRTENVYVSVPVRLQSQHDTEVKDRHSSSVPRARVMAGAPMGQKHYSLPRAYSWPCYNVDGP